jgi:hypothetical protein
VGIFYFAAINFYIGRKIIVIIFGARGACVAILNQELKGRWVGITPDNRMTGKKRIPFCIQNADDGF